ncbi:SpoIIE family protein phosphatase [Streptomyces sp. NPDC008150]|uniref:PP2C family protein-serine/threonine phosphatase n=1 Tax=Streptomyces sp. NPDC008150 TaxID=3364816 RepID=UPI0036EAA13C
MDIVSVVNEDDGADGPADADWAARLHALWMTTADVSDVTGMADHVYALLLGRPGVVAVAGSRWCGSSLRYARHLTDATGQSRPVTAVAEPGGGPDPSGAARHREVRDRAGDGLLVVARDLGDDAARAGEHDGAHGPARFDPEHGLLAAAGAKFALECRFSFGDGDWAAVSVGLASPVADDAPLRRQLSQVCDVLVAINRRIGVDRAHERRQIEEAFLAEASLQMDESLDIEETLSRVARLAVPAVAEGCVVHLFRPEGPLVPVAHAHVAATAQGWLAGTAEDDPWFAESLRLVTGRRHGVVLHGPELAGGPFGPRAEGPGSTVRAVSISPLRARGRALGTLSFLYERPDDDISDLRILDDLARRAALAIDTSTAYELRRRHVEQLQRHLLPPTLPTPEGLRLNAAYAVADASLDVGGDFYDAVRHGDSVALFIGDVCGRGAEAAAMTGLARHTLRTLLEEGAAPALALERLNSALVREGVSRFVTALVAVLVPDGDGGWVMETASAGHPRPLVRRADGDVEEVPAGGLLLGVLRDIHYTPVTTRLRPDDTLVMFTDGLTEARDDDGVMFEGRLPDAVRRCGAAPDDAAQQLVGLAEAFRTTGDDDTAVLVAHVREGR